VVVTVADDDLGVGSDTLTVTVLGAQDLKQGTIELLTPYEDESKRIKKAIKEIEESLEADLWLDEVHLDAKHGHRVFSEERHAVKELVHLLKGNHGKGDDVSEEALAAAQAAIENLVNADRVLALSLLNETTGAVALNPKQQGKVDNEMAKAWEEFAKGDAERDEGKSDKAIQHYRKAWEHAGHAAKEAAKAPHGNGDEDDDDDKGKGKDRK
jgi:tetratricopeptide (TPR) repeat protein